MRMIFNVLALCFAASWISGLQAAPVAWLPMENTRAERVSDPVFGGEIMVYEAGPEDAPTVALIHGIGDNGARDWRSLMIDLAPDYHVIAVDMPGFAASSKGNHLYAPDQLAVAVHGAISGRAKQPYSLIGHSLGATVSLAYAHLYSSEMQRLVLVDMPGVLHRYVFTRYLGEQGAQRMQGVVPLNTDWLSGLLTSQMAQLEARGLDPSVLLYSPWLRQNLFAGDPKAISAYAMAQHDFSAALRDLRLPTLLIWGELDPLAPLRTGQMVAAIVPGARLKVFEGVGHVPMAQVKNDFNAAIRDELSGRLSSMPAYALQASPPESGRIARCENRSSMRFSGEIKRLELENCTDAVVDSANIGRMEIDGGSVEIINSNVFEGIRASNAQLEMTAGSVRGEIPLILKGTHVDAAGTLFISDYDLAKNEGAEPLDIVFSVAVQRSLSGRSRTLHELVRLSPGQIWP